MRVFSRTYFRNSGMADSQGLNLCKTLSIKTLFCILLLAPLFLVAQGPNPQTGMRVIGMINLSGSCEMDTLVMENLTKDSAKTVKFYVHSYNYFNNPLYPNYRDTVYTKDNGRHIYKFKDSLVLANCFRSVSLYFAIIAYDTFGIDYPVISRINIYVRPRAIFVTDSVICAGEQMKFTNNSCTDSTKFKWVFSDTTITGKVPAGKSFNTPGPQTVKLIANTTSPCAASDTLSKTVNVLKVPEPGFKILRPSLQPFTDSVICLGDTLFLVNTSKHSDRTSFKLDPAGNFSLAGNSKLDHDTVKLIMQQKGYATIELHASNKACTRASGKKRILVIQNPYVRINPLPQCLDSSWIDIDKYVDTSTGVPKKVTWTISGNGLNMTVNSLYPGVLKQLKYGRYYLKVISVGGCRTLTSSDSFFVAPPVKTADMMSLCFGMDSIIRLNEFHMVPKGFSRMWSGPITNDSLFSSKGKSSGVHVPILTDRNSNCYHLPVRIEIIGNGLSAIPEQHICTRENTILALDSFIPADYSGKGVVNDSFHHKISGPGKFNICYKTVYKSCTFMDSLKISVYDPFSPQFNFITPGCQDSPVLFNKTTNEPVVSWTFGDGEKSMDDNPAHIYKSAGTYAVQLIARSHCPDTLVKPITIHPSPVAELRIVADTIPCDSVIIHAFFVNKGFGEKYKVRFGAQVYNGDSVRFAVAKSFQSYDTVITGEASSKCGNISSSVSIRIPQRNYSAVEILGLNPGCHGDTLKLVNASYGPIDSFRLDYGNGLFSKNKILKLPFFNNTTMLKDYSIVLTLYSKYCGVMKDTAHYKVIPNVIRAAGEHDKKTLCSYEMVTFINNSTEGTEFNLFFGDGGSSKGSVYHQKVNYQYLVPGVYVPYIKAVSGCGSDSVRLDTIRVNGAPSVSLMNAKSKMCLGSEVYLKCSPSTLLHPKWFVNAKLVDSLVNPFVFHPKAIGKYKISVLASNQFCIGLDSFDIEVESAPQIIIDVDDVTCDTLRVEITGNYTLGNLEVNWGDGVTDFAKLYHVYDDTGVYFVKIMLVEGLCTLYFDREITVKAAPRFNLLMHPRLTDCLNPGDTLNIFVELDSLPYQVDLYNWAGTKVCGNCERRMYNIDFMNCEPKEFKVVVRDKDNCRAAKEVNYACVDPGTNRYKAFVPNAFTPRNGDLLNDLYQPRLAYYDSGMDYQLRIYNRWGEMLFETTNPSVGWDGTFRGVVCQMDVYVYVIEYGCPGHRYNEHRGTLHLLR